MSATLAPQQAMPLGLPSLIEDEIPKCKVTSLLRTCSYSERMSQLQKQHPIFPIEQSPTYTNVAYAPLSFAQEDTTVTPFSEAITNNILSITTQSTIVYNNDGSSENLEHITRPELRRYDRYICKELPLAATRKLGDKLSFLPVALEQEVLNLFPDAIRDAQLQLFQGYMERHQLLGSDEVPGGCLFDSEVEGPCPPLVLNQGTFD
ncbi:uncharacterized protein FTOL_01482 [Fusarium torulosum]|uniref:Uncharacterized protein n=1 Tax=Fusarium torulosum TaxID=33205 RepID=A0AAE8M095_9HYPO|nr:uncharacterized protein FTOL_01482 [Fusarium torulosum]